MSFSATAVSNLTVNEDATSPFVNASKKTVTHDGLNETFTLSSGSSPPATLVAPFQAALIAGALTLDLTNLPGTDGQPVVGTGLKVRLVKFRNPATNANPITLTFGAANGYLLLGTAWKITLQPGQSTGPIYLKDAAPTIDATHKNIDVTGTGTQALDCIFVIG